MVNTHFVSVADVIELEAKLELAPCTLDTDKYLSMLCGQPQVFQSDFSQTLLAIQWFKYNLTVDYPDLEDEDRESLISDVLDLLNTFIDELGFINVEVNLPNP